MAYGDDIDALGAQHRWDFDGDSLDQVGTASGTDSSITYSTPALCEGVTNSAQTNNVADDRIVIPSTTDINNSAQTRKVIAGWFMVSKINQPPTRIYGEGDNLKSFSIAMGHGNSLIFEVDDSAGLLMQIYSDVALEPNRAYHLTFSFEGSGYANEINAYLDGVKQLNANPLNRQTDTASLAIRGAGVFADPSGNASLGGLTILLVAPVMGYYNEWCSFDGISLTDAQIREELFEKGALAETTITNQAGLDALASSVRPNVPCCIRVTGNGTINLTADDVTFDSLSSIHVQYTGTGTLNWTNTNGSNASIGSTPNGGTLNFINPATLTINGLINGCEIRIYDNETIDLGNNNTELDGTETLSGTTFQFNHSGASNEIVVQMIADGYEEVKELLTLNASDQTLILFPKIEENV